MNTEIKNKLIDLEERIAALELSQPKLINLFNYNKGEIQLIEEEGTNTVYEYLLKKYPGLITLKPASDYVKRLYDPITNKEITELDGLIILSNDPADIKNPKLNIQVSLNDKLNELYEEYLKEQIAEIEDKLDIHDHIIINNVVNLNNIIQPKNTLTFAKLNYTSQLEKLKASINFSIDKKEDIKYKRIFVIVETKHKVVEADITKKLQQINIIKNFIDQCKKYYEINKPLIQFENNIKRLNKENKKLRRERTKERITISKQLQKQEKNATNSKINEIKKKYELAKQNINDNNENDWTDDFELFCKCQNFDFDDVLLFMGGPLWESEELKNSLLQNKHGLILQSSNRYEIKK